MNGYPSFYPRIALVAPSPVRITTGNRWIPFTKGAHNAKIVPISSHRHYVILSEMYFEHYSDVIIRAMASQITGLSIVYSTVYSGADERRHQSSASLAFVRGIQRWPVDSPHKGPVTRKMLPFNDVIKTYQWLHLIQLKRYGYFHGIIRVHDRARKLISI